MLDRFEEQQGVTGALRELQDLVEAARRKQGAVDVKPAPGKQTGITASLAAIRLVPVRDKNASPAAPQQPERSTEPLSLPYVPDISLEDQTTPIGKGWETTGTMLPVVQRPFKEDSIRLEVGSRSDPGIRRKNDPNEDNILAIHGTCTDRSRSHPFGLFVVADGMGGHKNGQEASRQAVKAIGDTIIPAVLNNAEDEGSFAELLTEGAHHANLTLYRRNRRQKGLMGTTMTAALIVGSTAHIANVGDSRTYLYRHGELSQVTRDHSVVARLVEEKLITRDDIYTHPRRNEIYRCLGAHASEQVDSFTVSLQPGDSLLLCSDGLWEMVRDPQIRHILKYASHQPSLASTLLIQAALEAGGQDNVSVILVHVPASI
jgi:serine/threonine protein phosphatase PrpC